MDIGTIFEIWAVSIWNNETCSVELDELASRSANLDIADDARFLADIARIEED